MLLQDVLAHSKGNLDKICLKAPPWSPVDAKANTERLLQCISHLDKQKHTHNTMIYTYIAIYVFIDIYKH